MQALSVAQLIPVLQIAIGPTILISGVGLLLLTMTNRLARTIDRTRATARELAHTSVQERAMNAKQLRVLWKRARLIRLSIALASLSALFAAILMIVIFATALLQIESAWAICALFITCLACLIGSLVVFIHDINLALAALRFELPAEEIGDTEEVVKNY
jgi:hypothetical protein